MVTLGVALCSAVAIAYCACRSGPADLEGYAERLTAVQARSEFTQGQTDKIAVRLAANKQEIAAIDAVAGQPDWRRAMAQVGRVLGDRAMLTACRFGHASDGEFRRDFDNGSVDPESVWLVIDGIAQDYPEVPALVIRLETMGLFDRVMMLQTHAEPFRGQERIGFRIACRIQ